MKSLFQDPETMSLPGEGTNMVPPVPGYTRENGVLGVDAEIWLIQYIHKKKLAAVHRAQPNLRVHFLLHVQEVFLILIQCIY